MAAGDWMQGAVKRPGAFTKKAKSAGMSVAGYASKVTRPGSDATTLTKQQANFAKIAKKFGKKTKTAFSGMKTK